MVMEKRHRAFILVPYAGGGSIPLEKYESDKEEQEKLRQIFDGGIHSPHMPGDTGVLERSKILIETILDIDPIHKITIWTHSGGGIIVRTAMSQLRFEYPEVYPRIELIVMFDAAVHSATVPVPLLYLAVLGNKCKPIGTLENNIFLNLKGMPIDFSYELPDTIKGQFGREIQSHWPILEDGTCNRKRSVQMVSLTPHPDRIALLDKLKEWDQGRPWGEGIRKISCTNGGTETFEREKYLFDFKASFRFVVNLRLYARAAQATGDLLLIELDGCDLHIKGTKLNFVRLDLKYDENNDYCSWAPGSWGSETNKAGETIIKRAKEQCEKNSVKVKTAHYMSKMCYIPTTSSLDIQEKPTWIIDKSKEEILNASGFDVIYFNKENKSHGDRQWEESWKNHVRLGVPTRE